MIVISGALVLVALILLIIGVVGPDLTFVYASIVVSLVSLVFLVIGILQRRGEAPAAGEDAPAPAPAQDVDAEGVTAVIPAQGGDGSRKISEEPPVAATADEELETGGTVLVVQGRPRYHVEGCRYLSGRTPEPVDVLDAREEGFTPCGVCRPDDLLVERPALQDGPPEDSAVVEEAVVQEDVPGVEVAPPARRAAKAPARKAAAKRGSAASARASRTSPTRAVGSTTSRPATAPENTSPVKAPRKAATKPASKAATKPASKAAAPRKAAAPGRAAAAATPAVGAAAPAGSVVVIPDRGRFHRAECRYVRDVEQAEVLPKSAATRQGYAACGVCKP